MKKLLSLILALALIFSIVPTNLFCITTSAAENNPYITIKSGIEGKSFNYGDKITIPVKVNNFDGGSSSDKYYIVIKDSNNTIHISEKGLFSASKGADLKFTYDSYIFPAGKYYVYYYSDKVRTYEKKTSIDFTIKAPKVSAYKNVISGTQNGIQNNSKSPQSAWISTKLNSSVKLSQKDKYYQIRLEELYNDSYANAIAYREYFLADNFKNNQNWIIMKFWVKNLSKSSLDIDDIIDKYSFYDVAGGKQIFSKKDGRYIDVFIGAFSGKSAREVTIAPGKSGYFYVGILADKKYAYPAIKLTNGYIKKSSNKSTTAYTWLSTDVKTLKTEKGVTYYYVNGKRSKATTLVYNNGVWYYVKNGILNKSNTLVKYNGVLYHVKNGKRVNDTGIVKYNGALYYVKKGVLDKSDTLCKYNGKYYHVKGGKVVKDTTLVKYNNKLHYVKKGIHIKVTTLVKYGGKWYHIQNGVKSNYTGLYKYGSTLYYIKKGVNNSANTLVKYKNKWYHVNGGKTVKEKSTKYVAAVSSKTFHKSSCRHAKKISATNKYASDRNTMIKLGFKKCKTCKP